METKILLIVALLVLSLAYANCQYRPHQWYGGEYGGGKINRLRADIHKLRSERARRESDANHGEDRQPPKWDKGNAVIRKMCIQVDSRPDMEIDLDKDENLKKMKFVVKEGVKYRLMLRFNIQREIVSGLRFMNKITRKGIQVDKKNFMMGSYPPSKTIDDIYEWKSPEDEFPSGMLSRGSYNVKSAFTDDDKNELMRWEWGFEIKKDWE